MNRFGIWGIRGWLSAVCAALAFLAALPGWRSVARADEPALKFRLGLDDPAGGTAASDTNRGGLGLVLYTLDRLGALTNHQASPDGGPMGRGGALRLFKNVPRSGRRPVVAAATNASLALGEVRAFTATLWFKQSQAPGKLDSPYGYLPAMSRLFLLWSEARGAGATNSLEMGLMYGRGLQFKINGIGVQELLPFDLPTNQWWFAAMTYDGTNLAGYLGSESMPATLLAKTAVPGQTVRLERSSALYLGKAPRRFVSCDRWLAEVPAQARDSVVNAHCWVSFEGWLADARFYAGAGDDQFTERIRREAAGGGAPADEPPPRVSNLAESTDALTATQGVWLVATAPAFRTALVPLIERRRAQGFKVVVVETTGLLTPGELWLSQGAPLEARIRRLLGPGLAPKYVLLAGVAGTPDPVAARQVAVPALRGNRGRMIAWPSDYGFGLPQKEADGACAAAVGRFPARTVEEMESMVRKTLRLEEDCLRPGAWRTRAALLAGNPEAGPMSEKFVGHLMEQRLAKLHPAWNFTALFDIPGSDYYCPRGRFRQAAMDCLQNGALFAVYMGHSTGGFVGGRPNELYLSRDDWTRMNPSGGLGVFVSCGCYGCELGTGDGYCLAAMRNPAGPAAAIGAGASSSAAGGLLAGDGLVDRLARIPSPSRLGDYWTAVQAGLAHGPIDAMTFTLLDNADGSGGKVPLAAQRLELLEMWTLLGDPAMRLPVVPVDVALDVPGPVRAGQSLAVKGVVPARLAGAALRITLERPFSSRAEQLEPMPEDAPGNRAEQDGVAARNRARANSFVLASAAAVADGQTFRCSLTAPELPWPQVVVRAVAERGEEMAQGVAVLAVPGSGP